jgi:NTE family protein
LGFSIEEMALTAKRALKPGLLAYLPKGSYLNLMRLLRGRLAKRLRRHISPHLRLEQISEPRLLVTCTDLVSRSCVVLDSGNAIDAVIASCSLPGFAPPKLLGGMVLVDGGVASVCPMHVLEDYDLDLAIGVDVTQPRRTRLPPRRKPNLADTLERSFEVRRSRFRQDHEANADLMIRPDTNALSFVDTSARGIDTAIEVGYRAGEAALPALRRLVRNKTAAHVSPSVCI